MYKYSPSENSFYPDALLDVYEEAGSLPDDIFDVPEELFRTYTAEPPPGKMRVAGADGLPAWADIPPPTPEQLKEQAEQRRSSLKSQADAEIAWRQDAVDAGIATDEEASELADWKKYRVLLMRTDLSKAPDIDWPVKPGSRAS